MTKEYKLVRITTVPISLKVLLKQQLKFMAGHYNVLAVSSPGEVLEDVAINEGVRIASVLMTRSITPVKDLKALWQLYRLLKKERPTIVHTHTPKAGLLGMVASKLAGVPVRLHTVAGLPLMENKGAKKRMLELVEYITYRCATKIYPNSNNLARFILKNGYCKADKLKVLGNGSSNGIDTAFFQPNAIILENAAAIKKRLLIQDTDFVFVFIGRLVKDKGIEELVAAFTNLRKTYYNIKLLLVGTYEPELDPIAQKTETLIEENKDIIHVDFQQDIRPYLALSNVLAFPSYREGFPNVPMQAGCMNLPSIVTNINGCNEIIEHGNNGLIIPAKDTKALQEAMEILLTQKEVYNQMKAIARKLIIDRYEQKHFWSLLLKEYQNHLKTFDFVL